MKKDTNEITVSAFADKHRLDRRTIKRRLDESGLQPLRQHRGRIYYDYGALIGALSEAIQKKAVPRTPNLIRIMAETAIHSFCVDNLGAIAALAYEIATRSGLSEEKSRELGRALWVLSAGWAGEYLVTDQFNTICAKEVGRTLDQIWRGLGQHDESLPPKLENIMFGVPKCIVEWNKIDGITYRDPLPMGSGKADDSIPRD